MFSRFVMSSACLLSSLSCFAVGSAEELNSQGPGFLSGVKLGTKADELCVFLQPFFMGKGSGGRERAKASLG